MKLTRNTNHSDKTLASGGPIIARSVDGTIRIVLPGESYGTEWFKLCMDRNEARRLRDQLSRLVDWKE